MDDKKMIEDFIEKDERDVSDTDREMDGDASEEETWEEKSLKTQLNRAVLSSEEDGFSNIKQYPESPFTYFESNQVNVQLNTGNVQYGTTDFVLPGRDGFDLTIARRYNSGCANLVDMAPYVRNSRLLTGSINNSYYTSTYGLGHGWSFVLPSIETVQNLRWDWRPNLIGTRSYDYILHLEDGRNLEISRYSDHFENYDLNDVSIDTRKGTIRHPYATDLTKRYNLIIEYKNGNKDYFQSSHDDDGDRDIPGAVNFKLVARQDKFGNTIFYNLIRYGGMKIVDTWGRIISLEGAKNGLVWKLPESTAGKACEISYNISRSGTHKLTAVTDPLGRMTQYSYGYYNGSMKCAGPWVAGNNTKTKDRKYLLLESVTYPNYASTQFAYDRKISIENNTGGQITHLALTMKRDIVDGAVYNQSEYGYTIDTGYTYNKDSGNYIEYASVTHHQDIVETHKFDSIGQRKIKEVKHQKALISISKYNYSNKLIVSTFDYVIDRNDNSEFLKKKTLWKYSADGKANVTQYNEEYPDDPSCNQEIKTTYDDGDYSIVTETKRKKGTDQIRETNELYKDLGKRVIKYHRVYENGVLKEKTGYEYKDGANPYCVTNEKRYFLADGGDLDQSSEYAETIYKYSSFSSTTSRYTHDFISKEQIGILDADGKLCDPIREEFQYDNWGRLIFKKAPRNQVTTYQYDQMGRIIKETLPSADGQQAVNETYYNDRLNFITTTDANHQKKRIQYTPFGQIQRVCLAVSNEPATGDIVLQDFRYNSWGELIEAITYDGNGRTADHIRKTERYTYDSFGRVLFRGIDQVDYEEKYEYDQVFTDPVDGRNYERVVKRIIGDAYSPDVVTECYKDQKGQIRKAILAGERLFTYEYDNVGNKIQKMDVGNKVERWEYDYAGRIVKSIRIDSGQERITKVQYDGLGNKRFQWDEVEKKTEFQYDKAGRLVKVTAPFDHRSQIMKYYYDETGNVIREKKAQNNGWQDTQYVYDAKNRLTDTYQYLSQGNWIKTTCRYDAMDRILRRRTGDTPSGEGSEVVTYTYDRFGNVTTMTDTRGYTEYYEYDNTGRILKKTDRNKDQTIYQHDALERVIKETAQKKTLDGLLISEREYAYCKNGKRAKEISKESLGGKQNVLLEKTFYYNSKGQLTRQNDTGDTKKNYTYDIYGNRQSFQLTRTGNSNPEISLHYIYDDLYRLKQVRKNSAVGEILSEYEYDERGNRKILRYPQSGMETIYQYNDGNRVTALENKRQGTIISSWEYSYDVDGNILSKINKGGPVPITISYGYDRMGRLTEEDYSDWKRTLYTYDSYSNRMKMMVEGRTKDELLSVTSYEYGSNNRLEKEIKKQGKTTETYQYRYDDNGNETFRIWEKTSPTPDYPGHVKLSGDFKCEPPTVYEWRHYDGFNQLIRINQDDKEITYQYRGDGLRHSVEVRELTESKSKRNEYYWDGTNIVGEQTDNVPFKIYIRGINLIACETDHVVYYYTLNEHGDVTQQWNPNGVCKASYEYDAFGVEKNPDKEDKNPFRYCGEYFDLSSGIYYLRARYYDPTIGRFISEDSFRGNSNDSLTLNLYTYCGNNPIRHYDPDGHSWKEVGDRFKTIGEKKYDEASARAEAILDGADKVASNVGIDTAEVGAFLLMMDQDANGSYHARTDAWQQHAGYNRLFDAAFDFGTSMSTSPFEFSYGEQNYRLWAWKGDYINLGAGAELGIYQQMTVSGFGIPQWNMNKDITIKMSMLLSYKGNVIATYNPSDPQWWITSFNPNYKNVDASDLSVSFTVDFSEHENMYVAFRDKWKYEKNTPWKFDKKNPVAKLNY
ncbi:RHS repeat-associated core domain-containing protein [Clostridium sp. E02]|uniref:RHS repeat-associated core domain-containing protein n=1 Tax=Clostridium sp. E02 TaxID=2487134 RepID=UPI000F52D9EF|nr:RHS repeat-associated core domain-containing protein [Clostridium sp. E02]